MSKLSDKVGELEKEVAGLKEQVAKMVNRNTYFLAAATVVVDVLLRRYS